MSLTLPDLLARQPAPYPNDPFPDLLREVRQSGRSLVVLDDDPTGTQSVHHVPVLTQWHVEALALELADRTPLFYVLTNSRSLPTDQARELAREIGANLREAARQTHQEFTVISRSDSTLRGHFPAEVDALAEALGTPDAERVVIPAFVEGGRFTADDIHYVQEQEELVPVGQTPFARDATFGFSSSDLKDWVEEKSQGKIQAATVRSISLADIRLGGAAAVEAKLLSSPACGTCIVNALARRDLEVVALALLRAEARGRSFILRTAASFVQVRGGLTPRPLLEPAELPAAASGGGLVVVGSYVPKTTEQLRHLLGTPIGQVPLHVPALLNEERREEELKQAISRTEDLLTRQQSVVVYTSRELITGPDAASSLAIGNLVSECLVRVVRELAVRPRFVVAKGGITSSDLATKSLGVKKALVVGQILPGVPVWRLGPESKWPGLCYVVFPGNVGGADGLTTTIQKLSETGKEIA